MRTTLAGRTLVWMTLLATPAVAQEDCQGLVKTPVMQQFIANRVIVKPTFYPDPSIELLGDLVPEKFVVEPIGITGTYRIDSPILTTQELSEKFTRLGVDYVTKDYYIQAHTAHDNPNGVPNDQDYEDSTLRGALEIIHAPEAWTISHGDRRIIAAILDSGVNPVHDDLKENLFFEGADFQVTIEQQLVTCKEKDFGFDAISGDCQPEHRSDHGTQVAGIIGAVGDNGKGFVGVNWEVTLLPVAVLDKGNGGCASRAARGLAFIRLLNAARDTLRVPRVRVVNLSWGSTDRPKNLEEAVKDLIDDNVVVVASAGNATSNNDKSPVFPASFDSVIAVAATDRSGKILLGDSNHGMVSVHIAAPGDNVHTTIPDSPFFDTFSRTSAAAPFVTGAVALLASKCPEMTAKELRDVILQSADPIEELKPFVQEGRFLNVKNALDDCVTWQEARRGKAGEAVAGKR